MKQILLTVMAALLLVSCSKKEEEDGVEELIHFLNPYLSKDLIHCYAISNEHIYKQRISDNKIIWKKQCVVPQSIIVDLGYGEKKEIKFNQSYVLSETDNYLFILWRAENNNQSYYQIGLYSISGDFIKNAQSDYIDSYQGTSIINIENSQFLLFNRGGKGYTIIDYNLNIIESNDDIKLSYFRDLEFISNRSYITYDDNFIAICDLDKGTLSPDVFQFVKLQYPDEANQPKYKISNVSFSSSTIYLTLNITLFNGNKKTIKAKIDGNSGEIGLAY